MEKINFSGIEHFTWANTDSKRDSWKKERSDHLLPKNYKFSNNLRLSDAYKLFKAPSGQRGKRIPPLGSIKSGLFNFNLKKERRTFDKCKSVVSVMDALLDRGQDGKGKALKGIFHENKSYASLNALAMEAQRRFIAHLPETEKKRKRQRPFSMKVATANSYVAGIRKDTLGITSKR